MVSTTKTNTISLINNMSPSSTPSNSGENDDVDEHEGSSDNTRSPVDDQDAEECYQKLMTRNWKHQCKRMITTWKNGYQKMMMRTLKHQ